MIDWDREPLGQTSDSDLARKLGVARQLVAYHRRRRGIPSLYPPGGAAAKHRRHRKPRKRLFLGESRAEAQRRRRRMDQLCGITCRTPEQRAANAERMRRKRAAHKEKP